MVDSLLRPGRSRPATRQAGRMRPLPRRTVLGLAVVVAFGACGRGVPEQGAAPRGTEDLGLPERLPVETTTSTMGEAATTTSVAEPETTTSSTAPASTSATSATTAKAGDRCGSPAAKDFALTASGGQPAELAAAADGTIWFTDTGTSAIGRLAPDGSVRMWALSGGRDPASIAIGPGGDVWFTQYGFSKPADPSPFPSPPPAPPAPPAIGRISADGTMSEFPLPTIVANHHPAGGTLPRGITAGPDGAMWFTESGADQIGRIGPDGTITEYPLPPKEHVFNAVPDGLVAGPDDALWFTETLAGRIGRIDPATKVITERPIGNRSPNPMEWDGAGPLVLGPDGSFWFGNGSTTISRVTPDGPVTAFRVAPPADGIRSMVAGPDGTLWFADQRSPALFQMTTEGAVTRLWTPPGAPKAYESLGGMVVAPGGVVWVTQPWANKITRLTCPGPPSPSPSVLTTKV